MQKITRRDLLKLISMLPLIQLASRNNPAARLPARQAGLPNVLIIIFDTLSAKHLSLYGYERETTPNLARFAERASVYHRHYSGGNFTTPGTASLLTGTYPWTHRAFNLGSSILPSFYDRNIFSLAAQAGLYSQAYTHNNLAQVFLNDFAEHIDELLKTGDLQRWDSVISDYLPPDVFRPAWNAEAALRGTGGIKPSSFFLGFFSKLADVFSWKKSTRELGAQFPRGIPGTPSSFFLVEDGIDWILHQSSSLPRPYLAYYHFLPPHSPYTTRREFTNIFMDDLQPARKPEHHFSMGYSHDQMVNSRRFYDEYIPYVDAEFGRLYDSLVESGALEDTCLIFTSDHGELFERGIIGHNTPVLYESITKVPLLISTPGQTTRRDFFQATSAVDLLPTFQTLLNQPVPGWTEGVILPGFQGSNTMPDRGIYTIDAKQNPKNSPLTQGTVSLVKNDLKLVHYFGYDGYEDVFELYDLAQDPEELIDLYPSLPSAAASMREELLEKVESINK